MDKQQNHILFDAYHMGDLPEQECINFEQDLKKDAQLKQEFDLYLAVVNIVEQQGENDLRAFLTQKTEAAKVLAVEQVKVDKNAENQHVVGEKIGEERKKGRIIPFYFKAIAASIAFFIASYFLFNTFENKTNDIAKTEEHTKTKSNKAKGNASMDADKEENLNVDLKNIKKVPESENNVVSDDENVSTAEDTTIVIVEYGDNEKLDIIRKPKRVIEVDANSKEINKELAKNTPKKINTEFDDSSDGRKLRVKKEDLLSRPVAKKIASDRTATGDAKFKVRRDRNVLDTQLLLNNYSYVWTAQNRAMITETTAVKDIRITNSPPLATPGKGKSKALKKDRTVKKDSAEKLPPLVYYKLMINESPINYKGYKFDNKTKLINVYGLKTTNLEFFFMKNDYYLRSGNNVYLLKNTTIYSPFIVVKDKEIIEKIKEYSAY